MHSVSTLEEAAASPATGNNCCKKARRACPGLLSASSCCPTMPSTESEAPDDLRLFPVEDIVQHPLPGYVAPSSVAFSPDDSLISYLYSPDFSLSRKVFSFDPSTCYQQLLVSPPDGGVDECNLSTSEKLRRERLRERGLGVTRYEWAKAGSTRCLMVPLPGGIYIQDHPAAELRLRIASSPCSPIIDPHLSPDGSSIAFVRDDELYVASISSGDPVQITFGARSAGKTHGLAEYIAQEEMERRNGFWWSSDSKLIAYTEVDATGIPNFRIMHQGKATVGGDAQEDHPYPFAGHANVKVRLGVVNVTGGGSTWLDLHCGDWGNQDGDEEYLARVAWMPDNSLTAQVQNRSHSKLKLLKFDVTTGARHVLLVEENDVWVNLHDCFTPLQKGVGLYTGGFVWASESSGFRHLFLHDGRGYRLGQLTEGDWMVEQVAGIDENAGLVYFTATLDSPIETHLYSAKLFPSVNSPEEKPGEKPRRLTQADGRHVVVLDHQLKRFVDMHDSIEMPPCVLLCSLETGKVIVPIYEQPAPTLRTRKLNLALPEIVQIPANDGTILYGALYKPDSKQFGPPPYRTVVSVYGGPNVQTVWNSWMMTVDMRAQYFRSRGLLVWKVRHLITCSP
ncbi:hypothetical protein O6H91_Y281400 [Diphasiastrum complanatum]|nr:hypothetical protein O6H91_Y281400 [Diphasiastrum complanatum]